MARRSEIEAQPALLPEVDHSKDYGPNGLQVEGRARLRRLVRRSPRARPGVTLPLDGSVLRR